MEILLAICALEAAQGSEMNTQGDGILCRKVLRCGETPADEILVFRYEKRLLISGGIIRTQVCFTGEHDDIATSAVTVEVEGHAGMLLQMLMAFGTSLAVHQDRRRCCIPQEPHGIWLWRVLAIYRSKPDNMIIV